MSLIEELQHLVSVSFVWEAWVSEPHFQRQIAGVFSCEDFIDPFYLLLFINNQFE